MSSGNTREAIIELGDALKRIFKKYARGSRDQAWKTLISKSGKEEVEKLINNPDRPTTYFRSIQISFKEWIENQKSI